MTALFLASRSVILVILETSLILKQKQGQTDHYCETAETEQLS